MSLLRSLAGTSSVSIGLPNSVRILRKSPFVVLSRSRFPLTSGPARPFESSKLLGSAAMAAPALRRIVLNAIVGRVDSSWMGANESSLESTLTCPPPNQSDAWPTVLTKARFEAESESLRKMTPPQSPAVAAGPTPSEFPPIESS